MSPNREIPFGYTKVHLKVALNEVEANLVKQIFSMYINGCSLKNISDRMEETGIPYYTKSNLWNKNIIKRILENERYIGTDEYPRIVDPDIYLSARLKSNEKQSQRTPRLESLKEIGKIIMCKECSCKMRRHTKGGVARWTCTNEECKQTVKIPDETLRAEIDQTLDRLAQSPALLDPCAPDGQPVTPAVLRLQNELTAAFNRGAESPEYIRSLIFALASEQYKALPDMSLIHTLKELQGRIAAEGITEDNRREIEQKAVRRILLGRESGVSIELINGKVISNQEEAAQ